MKTRLGETIMSVISRRTKRWDHSGVNLGGIGAGKLAFCPSGRFSNVMTQNNWDAPIAHVNPAKRAEYHPEGVPGAFLAAWVEGAGAVALKETARAPMKTLKRDDMRYEGQFPRADVTYPKRNGVAIAVEAFSSLDLASDGKDHYKDSSLPAAAFVFRVKNASKKPRKVSVLMSWQNLVGAGGFVDGIVNDRRRPANHAAARAGCEGIVFGADVTKLNPRVDGQYVLATEVVKGREVFAAPGYDQTDSRPGRNLSQLWEAFDDTGELPAEDPLWDEAWTNRASGAVAVRIRLRPGQTAEVPFVLSWFFPHLIANEHPEIDYGHAYQNWFKSAWDVADYFLKNRRRLHAQTRAWQRMLEDANLPEWFVEKLCNDLFSLFACSWYTRDWRHTVNESPTDMGGCHGTVDQRSAACAAYEMCFPALSKSELTLFAEQQVGARHPDRVGKHWDMKRGRFGKRLDRKGAIRHDTGWDHIEGGQFGSPLWQNLHWPDLTSVFVLECVRYVQWTGDKRFLKWAWPRMKAALDFQTRLDQNNDGVADLWGHGSNTYDSQELHYYGASAFIASLFIAANIVVEDVAALLGDRAFVAICRKRLRKAKKTYDGAIWNDARGHFNSWVDTNHRAWKGTDREHEAANDSSMIAQIAGQWYANLLGMSDTTDRAKIAGALGAMYRMNVGCVKGCPAIDAAHDGTHNYAWPQYSEVYYAANAMYEGRPDEGMRAVKKIYNAQYKRDGSPWDTSLKWAGDENDEPAWGRWYMTNPASWFLLQAITGVGVDHLRDTLTVAPNIPKEIGDGKKLSKVPVFFPKFHATVDCTVGKRSRCIRLTVARLIGGKTVRFTKLRLQATDRLPKVSLNGTPLRIKASVEDGRFITLDVVLRFAADGDVLEVIA